VILKTSINVDQDLPVVNLLTDEEIAASARKTGECVSELISLNISDCEDDVDEPSVSARGLKVNEVIEKISEVMRWMERQPECEQIHLMHLAVIKQYALKKRSGQVR
jgi:hypothetical protein